MTAFDEKSPAMQEFLNGLFDVTGAQASRTCSVCGATVNAEAFSELEAREYGISGLCLNCQHVAFSAPPDPDDAVYGIPAPHADYPHEPGTLYDCAGCEMGPCVCGGETGCVSEHCNAPGHPDGQAQRMVQCSHLFCPEDCPGWEWETVTDGAIAPASYDGPITNRGFGE